MLHVVQMSLKAAVVIGAVLLLDDVMSDALPKAIYSFLPAWCWLLPGERVEPRVPFVRKDPPPLI